MTLEAMVGIAAGGVTVLGTMGAAAWKSVKFFIGMDTKVTITSGDVHTILNNHLPHIYSELGGLRNAVETRNLPPRDTRRSGEDRE